MEQSGYKLTLPGGEEVLLTRKHFLYGCAGVAALAGLSGISYAFDYFEGNQGGSSSLAVPSNAVATTDTYSLIEDTASVMRLAHTAELPHGSLVWASCNTLAACLFPTDSSGPLTQVALLNLTTGKYDIVMQDAVGSADGFAIYDVRAVEAGVVWIEANILKGQWRVYQAPLAAEKLGAATLSAEGDANWDMPTLAAVGSYAFWQVQPKADGSAKDEPARIMRVPFGGQHAEEIFSRDGNMACSLYATQHEIIAAPHAENSASRYCLTCIDAATSTIKDSLTLPSYMKPFEIAYGNTGFSFAFDAIYNYGDGISNLGTYVPTTQVVRANTTSLSNGLDQESNTGNYSSANWFRFPRTPSAPPAWCKNWFMVKSTSAVVGLDFAGQRYFALNILDGATDYGDYLATTGTCDKLVTFANVDYTPINGEQKKNCTVRIWEAV